MKESKVDLAQLEQEIIHAYHSKDLKWTHMMKLSFIVDEHIEQCRANDRPIPPGYLAMAHILTPLCAIPIDEELTTSKKKNELWRFLGLGTATTDTVPRDSCVYGAIVLMRALGRSDEWIRDFGFADIDVPESVVQAQLVASKGDDDALSWLEGDQTIEEAIAQAKEMIVFNAELLPTKGPKSL